MLYAKDDPNYKPIVPTKNATKTQITSYLTPSLLEKYGTQKYPLLVNAPASADIGWEPDYEKYVRRSEARLASKEFRSSLPEGWPKLLHSSMSWTPASLTDLEDYVYTLSNAEKEEIDKALNHFKGLKLEVRDISRDNFPLTNLTSSLESLRDDVHFGKGFFVLRGLDPSRYSGEENIIIFLGVSCYIAEKRGRQDQDGNMLVHILDATARHPGPDFREAQSVYTNAAQPFHNDVVCDVLGLQTMNRAAKGGCSIIASAWTVYNELAATRPDLIETLAASNWTFDTFGRDPPYHQRPLLYHHKGRITLNFSRRLITGSAQSPRTANIPPITEAQAEAIDAIHFIAQKHQLSISMMPGDLRFINNLSILHCRDSFQDGGDAHRHLVRLWLRNEQLAWSTPPELQLAWDRVFADLPDSLENWNIEPDISEVHVTRRDKSCGQG